MLTTSHAHAGIESCSDGLLRRLYPARLASKAQLRGVLLQMGCAVVQSCMMKCLTMGMRIL